MEALLAHHDPALHRGFRERYGGCQGHAWTLLQTVFSEVLSRKVGGRGWLGGVG